MKIEVSHESPLSLLEYSTIYNDYGYALVHLFEKHPKYFEYFKRLKLRNIPVLLDNSIFELGTAFDSKEYSKWINKLNPNYYIVPDVLFDADGTINEWCKFFNYIHDADEDFNKNRLSIGVVTGKTKEDAIECYKFMAEHADYIAIGFNLPWYQDVSQMLPEWRFNLPLSANTSLNYSKYEENKEPTDTLTKQCFGRITFINHLIESRLWNWMKPHHLLGCSLAKEFKQYHSENIWNIKSVDTSNPVVAAYYGQTYNGTEGLQTKVSVKLADIFEEAEFDSDQMQNLDYNVLQFKKILGRY